MKRALLCLVFILFTAIAYSEQTSKIELNDGNIITAKIISLANGIYTLDAGSLGKINIEASKIKRIDSSSSTNTDTINTFAKPNSEIQSQMDTYKTKMMNNPDVLKIAGELTTDPQFQEIMKDPQIVNAVSSGDMQTLMSNQKFMSVINHPKIEEIREKLQE